MVATNGAWERETARAEAEDDEIDLGQYARILKRRWLPALLVLLSTLGLAGAYSWWKLQNAPVFESSSKFLYETSGSQPTLPEGAQQLVGGQSQGGGLPNQIEILQSRPLAQKVIDKLGLTNKQGEPLDPDALLERIQVEQVESTNVIKLSAQSNQPQQAAQIANTLMDVYQQRTISEQTAESRNTRQFLESQIPQVRQEVRQAEAALRRFKEQNNVVALDEEAKSIVKATRNINERLSDARASLDSAESRATALRNKVGMSSQQGLASAQLSQSPGVQQVLQQYQEVETELANKQSELTPQHPAVQALQEQRSRLRAVLRQRVRASLAGGGTAEDRNLQLGETKVQLISNLVNAEVERLGLVSQVNALQQVRDTYQARANQLPQLEQRRAQLERELQTARSTLKGLLEQLQKTRIEENRKSSKVDVVERAQVPGGPVSPKIALNLALGGVLGALLGGAAAFALDARDRRIHSAEDAQQLLGYPMLGSVPNFDDVPATEGPRTPHPEAEPADTPSRAN